MLCVRITGRAEFAGSCGCRVRHQLDAQVPCMAPPTCWSLPVDLMVAADSRSLALRASFLQARQVVVVVLVPWMCVAHDLLAPGGCGPHVTCA